MIIYPVKLKGYLCFFKAKSLQCPSLGSSVSFTSGVSPRIWPHPRCLDPLRSGRTIPSYVSENHPCCRTENCRSRWNFSKKRRCWKRRAQRRNEQKGEMCLLTSYVGGERLGGFAYAGWMDLFFLLTFPFCFVSFFCKGHPSSLSIHG